MTADCGGQGAGSMLRTQNMPDMLVTREVSQLSGWLKTSLSFRGSQAGQTVRPGYTGNRAVCTQRAQG